MKLPLNRNEQDANELLALGMIQTAPADWLEFYHQVREYVKQAARVRAGRGKVPKDNASLARASRVVQYVLDTLDGAERDMAEPCVIPFFGIAEGGAS